MSNELINDIEDSLKRDELRRTWEEYAPYLIGGVVLAVLLTGLIAGWRSWEYRQNVASTTLMLESVAASSDTDASAAALIANAPDMRGPHRTLSRLSAAGMLAGEGKMDEALAQYQAAAADRAAPAPLRDLAQLMAVRLEWSVKGEDASDTQTLANSLLEKLKPLYRKTRNPYHAHARLEAAIITAHGLGDYARAQEHLRAITDSKQDLPVSVIERAKALARVYAQQHNAQ